MATAEPAREDIFLPGGHLCTECVSEPALKVLREALKLARETRWDSVRSPHVFMGLLSAADPCVQNWGDRLRADYPARGGVTLLPFPRLFFVASRV